MAQKTKRVRRTKGGTKHATPAATKASKVPKAPKVPKVATGVRAKAARRTAEGKFTKIIFNQIGGKECPVSQPMTWKERDAFMAKPENAASGNATKSTWRPLPRREASLHTRSCGCHPRLRWPRLKKRVSSRGNFLLVMPMEIGEKYTPKTSRKTSSV